MKLWERLEQRRVHRFYAESDEKYFKPRPHPECEPGHDLRPEIQHVVVLMMENHSFDNYFGCLGKGEGLDHGPRNDNRDAAGTVVSSHPISGTSQRPHVPTQSWHASHLQWNGGANDGFVRSVEETIRKRDPGDERVPMGFWNPSDLPFYRDLACTFPLADHWFGSCLGPTLPNRRFLVAGTADGLIDDLPFGLVRYPAAGTVFDLLTRNEISWRNYHDVSPVRVLAKRVLGRGGLRAFRRLASTIATLWPPLLTWALGNLQFTADVYPLGLASSWGHLRSLPDFFRDAREGTLPDFSIVDPNFHDFSEENPQDIADGEGFAARVVDALMKGKNWDRTLLIWTYDEHGGYYDHVSPPAAVPPDKTEGKSLLDLPGWMQSLLGAVWPGKLADIQAIDGDSDRRYDRYGFRVPTVLVSPYAKPNCTISETFDHTSILKLLEEKWNLPSLTARDAAATAPWAALDFTTPPTFAEPPTLAEPKAPWHPQKRFWRR